MECCCENFLEKITLGVLCDSHQHILTPHYGLLKNGLVIRELKMTSFGAMSMCSSDRVVEPPYRVPTHIPACSIISRAQLCQS